MLEFLVLRKLCGSIGRLSQAKGLPVLWFQAILIAGFFAGEVYGGVAAAVMAALAAPSGHHPAPIGLMYACAMLGGGTATMLIFGLAWIWPNTRQPVIVTHCNACGEGLTAEHDACPMCGHGHQQDMRIAA